MTDLITVKEYLNNKNLLIINDYIPYTKKMEIVNKILNNVITTENGVFHIDYVLLNRVKIQIYIEQLTNLSLSAVDELEEIDGYDMLVKYDELNNLIYTILKRDMEEFNCIMELKLKELENISVNLQMYLDYKIGNIMNHLNEFMSSILSRIENIDVESIIKNFDHVINFLGNNNIRSFNNLKESEKNK